MHASNALILRCIISARACGRRVIVITGKSHSNNSSASTSAVSECEEYVRAFCASNTTGNSTRDIEEKYQLSASDFGPTQLHFVAAVSEAMSSQSRCTV